MNAPAPAPTSTQQVRVTLTDAAYRRIAHTAVDVGHRSPAEALRVAGNLYADLGPLLPRLRARARDEGRPLGDVIRKLLEDALS